MEFSSFEQLEGKIRIIINEYSLLKKRNDELEEILKNKSLELEEANKNIKGLKEERDFIRTKVDSLLDMLQDIKVPQ